jgi:hypothetical protein
MALERTLSIQSSFSSSTSALQPSAESWLVRKAQQPGILAELCEEALSYPACDQGDTFHQVLEAAIIALIPLSGSGDSQQLQQWQAQQQMQQQGNDLVQDSRRHYMELMNWDDDSDSVDDDTEDEWQQQCQDSEDSSSATDIGGHDSSSSFCTSRTVSDDSTSSIERCEVGTADAVHDMAGGGSSINSDSTDKSRGQASSAARSWRSSRVCRGLLFAAAAAASAGAIIVGVRMHAARR